MRECTKFSERQFAALDFKLNALIGAVNRHADSTGKWLAIIAQAIAGQDKDAIEAQVAKLNQATEALDAAVDSNQPQEKEN